MLQDGNRIPSHNFLTVEVKIYGKIQMHLNIHAQHCPNQKSTACLRLSAPGPEVPIEFSDSIDWPFSKGLWAFCYNTKQAELSQSLVLGAKYLICNSSVQKLLHITEKNNSLACTIC